MSKWRKKKIIARITEEEKATADKIKSMVTPNGWETTIQVSMHAASTIQRVKAVYSAPLLKITIGNRAFEISSKYRFRAYKFYTIKGVN